MEKRGDGAVELVEVDDGVKGEKGVRKRERERGGRGKRKGARAREVERAGREGRGMCGRVTV